MMNSVSEALRSHREDKCKEVSVEEKVTFYPLFCSVLPGVATPREMSAYSTVPVLYSYCYVRSWDNGKRWLGFFIV